MPFMDAIRPFKWRRLFFLFIIVLNLIWILLFISDPTYIMILTNFTSIESFWRFQTIKNIRNHTEIMNLQRIHCSNGCNIARKYENPNKIKELACSYIHSYSNNIDNNSNNDAEQQKESNPRPRPTIHFCVEQPDPIYAWYWGQQINLLYDLQKIENQMTFQGAIFYILQDNATLSLNTEIALIQAGYPFLSHSHLINFKQSNNNNIVKNAIETTYGNKIVSSHNSISSAITIIAPFIFQPDFHFINSKGFISTIKSFNVTLNNIERKFRRKEDKVFWRGSSTGSAPTCDELPRLKLSNMSNSIPWIDVRISKYVDRCMGRNLELSLLPILKSPLAVLNTNNSSNTTKIPLNQNISSNRPQIIVETTTVKQIQKRNQAEMKKQLYVKEVDWLKYKGIIDIDGHVNAWGLIWRLASGSLLFKVESQFTNAYIDQLQPWIHYIPIQADLSDVLNQTSIILKKMKLNHTNNINHIINSKNMNNNNDENININTNSNSTTKSFRRKKLTTSSAAASSATISLMVGIIKNAKLLANEFTYANEVQRVVSELNSFRETRYLIYKDIVISNS